MTQPYYTATAGPADGNAGFRAKAYASATVLLALLGLGTTVFGLSQGIADGGEQVIQGVLTLIGAIAPGVAAVKTNTQVKNGTFDAPPPQVAPVDNALESLATIKTEVDRTVDLAQARVSDGINFIQAAASLIPGGKPADFGGVLSPVSELMKLMQNRPAPEAPHPAPQP